MGRSRAGCYAVAGLAVAMALARQSAAQDLADTALAAAVAQAVAPAPLTPAAAAGLTQLDASARGITTLEGIGQLSALRSLNLALNQISDLRPLAALAQLQELDLSSNAVEDLAPLAGLARLRLLNLQGNRVRDLSPLLGLGGLQVLEVQDNPLDAAGAAAQVAELRAHGVAVGGEAAAGGGGEEPISEGLCLGCSGGWALLGPNAPEAQGLDPCCVAYAPSAAGVVYASTALGVWRSDDGGASWGPTSMRYRGYSGLVVSAGAPHDVYVGYNEDTPGWPWYSSAEATARSSDGGRTWAPVTVPGQLVAADPGEPDQLYAQACRGWTGGAWACTLSVSQDRGVSWDSLLTVRAGEGRGDAFVRGHPADARVRYAGVTGKDPTGLFVIAQLRRSEDSGRTWEPVALGRAMVAIAPGPEGVESLYGLDARGGGVWVSGDAGRNWEKRWAGPSGGVFTLQAHPADPTQVWAEGVSGLWRSEDAGFTWATVTAGVPGLHASAVILRPERTDEMLLQSVKTLQGGNSTEHYLHASADGGRTWEDVTPRGVQVPVSSLAVGPDGALYAATAEVDSAGAYPFILVRQASGTEWQRRAVQAKGVMPAWLGLLAVDPHDRQSLLACAGLGDFVRSDDGGITWQGPVAAGPGFPPPGAAPAVVTAGEDGATLLLLDPRGGTLYGCTGRGCTPEVLRSGVWRVAARTGPGAAIYVVNRQQPGMACSTDGGHSWRELVPPSLSPVHGLAVEPWGERRLHALTADSLYVLSGDAGRWEPASRLPLTHGEMRLLQFHPTRPGVLYLLIQKRVYGSADGGRTWSVLADEWSGMPAVAALAVDPVRPGTLYAATTYGVCQLSWPEGGTAVIGGQRAQPAGVRLLPSYPNPFNGATTIRYELDRPAVVRLTVYSAAGQVVRRLVGGPQEAGRHSMVWNGTTSDGRSVASGVYLLELDVQRRDETPSRLVGRVVLSR